VQAISVVRLYFHILKAEKPLRYFCLAYVQDISMMLLLNAKERSLDDFKALGSVFCVEQWAGKRADDNMTL
jgi:hypothetical protein